MLLVVRYGAKYRLWNPDPEAHHSFPKPFKRLVRQLLFLKPQANCPLSWQSSDVLYYILNMCRWDWVPGLPEDHPTPPPAPPSPPEHSSPGSGDLAHMPRWYRGSGDGGGFSGSSSGSGGGGGSTREATAQLRELRAQLFQAQARAMLLQAAHQESQSLRGREATAARVVAAAVEESDDDEDVDEKGSKGAESPGGGGGGYDEDSDDDSDGLGGGSGTLGGLPASLLWHLRLFGSLGGGNGSGSNRSSGGSGSGGGGGNSSSPHGNGGGSGSLMGTGGAPSPLLPSAWSTPGLTANHSLASSAAASGSVSRAPSRAGSAASTPPLPQVRCSREEFGLLCKLNRILCAVLCFFDVSLSPYMPSTGFLLVSLYLLVVYFTSRDHRWPAELLLLGSSLPCACTFPRLLLMISVPTTT